MPQRIETRVNYRKLYSSEILSIYDFCCDEANHSLGKEEASKDNSIVFMRRGAFTKHVNGHKVTADVNQSVFFTKDSVYRVSHPAGCGDRGTMFIVASQIQNDIIRELDPTIDEHPDRPFAFISGPCNTKPFWRHRELVRRLERASIEQLEHLWIDVTGLRLIADVLESAFEKYQKPSKTRRENTRTDHAEKAEAAKVYLSKRMSEPVMLNEIAHAVGSSPFSFARIFQQQTGLPIHRYLTLLRLRASLERLSDGENDMTNLALDLGFSSHSHFTDLFHREFGMPPSEIRTKLQPKTLREISKNLIV
jgi:AraC family transcriptional regulator